MGKHFISLASVFLAISLLTMSGCKPLKDNLKKTVLMEYDQVNNFRSYSFQPGTHIPAGNWGYETGINGWLINDPSVKGFWVTYVVCSIRNEGSQAQSFPFNMNKFYVVYEGKKFYHKPLETYTYSSIPNQLPGSPEVNGFVSDAFHDEILIGNDTDSFAKGYYPNLNYRFSIYVNKSSSGGVNSSVALPLRYEGYPSLLSARGHMPVVHQPTSKTQLRSSCRPKAN